MIAAVGLATAAAAASAATAGPDAAILPAPPPASYCRVGPPAGWPVIGTSPTPDLSAYQDYRAGLAIPAGAAGAGVRIGDVEYEWTARHEELASRNLPEAVPTGLSPAYRARDHGTAVLGVLGAGDDGHGVTGLAPASTLRPISPFSPDYAPAAAIGDAADGLRPGDILLVELQSLVVRSDGSTLLGPIEFHPSVRDAIAKAVAKGVIVVEPAGNGDLDVGSLGAPWLSDPSDEDASGAIMVGAGGSGLAQPAVDDRARVPGSNWGDRVDVQGVGAGVVTSGYSDISGTAPERSYTACFDGTSSASATVAAAAAVLQGEVIARTGSPLTPAAMREALVSSGLPQETAEGSPVRNIGPRPQVAAALAALAVAQPPPAVPGGGTPPPSVAAPAPAPAPVPAPFVVGAASSAATPADAVRGLGVGYRHRGGRLVVTLRSAAPGATARLGARRVAVRSGRIVLTGVRPGRLVLRVSAPARSGVSYRAVGFRITITSRGAVTVARV